MKIRLVNVWKYKGIWIPSLFGVVVFLFWWLVFPQALNYHEQNQLFLFGMDYLAERLSVAGGLADYIAEFIVQFYYLPWLGALLLALLFVAIQQLTQRILLQYGDWWLLGSFLTPVLLLCHMGDINVLLSFPIALIVVLGVTLWMGNRWLWLDIVMVPLLYWLVGPVVWSYVLLRIFPLGWRGLWAAFYLLGFQLLLYVTLLQQWPLENVLFGVNYYFKLMHFTILQFLIPLSVPLMAVWACWTERKNLGQKAVAFNQGLVLVVVIWVGATGSYNRDIYELLMQDKLVREGKWTEIIERAEKYQVPVNFSCNCVNLALAQKRQLADRMFRFYQSGEDAMMMPRMRDNMSAYPTMEVFWNLGMVNSCLRYASDLQESILNARKSGRLTKRITECQIVNGNYPIAQKNIDLLKKSLFYRSWAEKMEAILADEPLVENDPVLGKVRKYRFKKDFIFSYEEIEKMMGLLFVDNPDNKMALDYFMGEMLLKGNLQGFTQYMSWVQQYGGYPSMPAGYQDAVNCIKANGNVPGSPYAAYAKRMMKEKGGGR